MTYLDKEARIRFCEENKESIDDIHEEDPLLDAKGAFGDLSEDKYKAEVTLAEKYQSFIAEILRLSLLGIAVFGFLYKEILQEIDMNLFNSKPIFLAKYIGAVGVLMFVVSIGSALAFRYNATEGVRYYIMALRFSEHNDETRAQYCLCRRKRKLRLCIASKMVATFVFGLGGLFVSASIVMLLNTY